MSMRVFLTLVIGAALAGSTSGALAQETGSQETGSTKAAAQTGKSGDEDLGQLSKELEAAEAEEANAATEQARAAESAMNSYQARARRQAIEARERLTKDPLWKPTHAQVSRIEIGATLNNMCLDNQGRILACCGDKILRVVSQEGKVLENRRLDFIPQAISVRPIDGVIFVAGQGQLLRMSPDGEVQEQIEFPAPPTEEEREAIFQKLMAQAEQQLKQLEQLSKSVAKQLETVKEQLAKEQIPAEERTKIAKMRDDELFGHVTSITMTDNGLEMCFKTDTPLGIQARALEFYLQQLGGVDIQQQRKSLEANARRQAQQQTGQATYTGLAVAENDLFVICTGVGYSYNAWRMTHDFKDPKLILPGLSGCCGQMDCQTHDGNLWLAMNTQHKVISYDRDGNELNSFGRNDGTAADGFGGCCEPKNLRFSKDGKYVYCAQSGPPVCVKRFTLDGEFQDTVCFPIFETGCVRVSVDVDGDTFFLMSPDESTVYVFQPDES